MEHNRSRFIVKRIFDEEALRQAIGRQSSHGSVLRTPEDPTTDDEPAPPPEAVASEACEPRRRRLRMPDYEQTFLCVSDVQRRAGIYASEETKRKLLDVVQLLGRGNLSPVSYTHLRRPFLRRASPCR